MSVNVKSSVLLPELHVDLNPCEAGAPCTDKYVCRIHRIRAFFRALGWVK
jgi:hypothetical protein